jgi:hypothetical protein
VSRADFEIRSRTIIVLLAAIAATSVACGGVASGTLQLKVADKVKVRVSPDGAVIMNNRRVATINDQGKVIGSDGKLLAWLNKESIRLPGGASMPIKTDPKGNLYLPKSAQDGAKINEVRMRVGAGGQVVTRDGGPTNFVIDGASDIESRRVGLVMLLLFANPPVDTGEQAAPGDSDPDMSMDPDEEMSMDPDEE